MFNKNNYTVSNISCSNGDNITSAKFLIKIRDKVYECNNINDIKKLQEEYSITIDKNDYTYNPPNILQCKDESSITYYKKILKDGKTLRRERRKKERNTK